jgi:hypothetical protein
MEGRACATSGPGLAPVFSNPLAPERDLVENYDVF